MLIGATTQRVDIPHEPGEWLELRMLSWLDLEEARAERQARALQLMRGLGADLVAQLQGVTQDGQADGGQQELDRATVLRRGLVGWSYGPFSSEAIGQLDEATAAFAYQEILRLSLPSEGDQKNS